MTYVKRAQRFAGGRRRSRYLTTGLLALVVAAVFAVAASADSGDVKVSGVFGGQGPQHPVTTASVAMDANNQPVSTIVQLGNPTTLNAARQITFGGRWSF